MSQFIQLHILTSFPPSNLNRDDLGRPKTAKMGGFDRLRVSSQSLKRNWRISDLFVNSLSAHIGIRTKRFGRTIYQALVDAGVNEKPARSWSIAIANVYGKCKKDSLDIEQLAHISPAEQDQALALTRVLAAEDRGPSKDELKALLNREKTAVDIALFGRMLASSPEFSVEAACQVSHALSVHSVVVEDDYFTAVDDLNDTSESGSAHIGESCFAAALFYSNLCINKTQLIKNLDGDVALANKAIRALTETAVKVAPKGKQNSFASRVYASFVLAEKGDQQPRSLSVAFLKPVVSDDIGGKAVEKIMAQVAAFDSVYGACADSRYSANAFTGEGSFSQLADFVVQ